MIDMEMHFAVNSGCLAQTLNYNQALARLAGKLIRLCCCMTLNQARNSFLVVPNAQGWMVPGALLRPLLASLKIQTSPQNGRQFTETIAKYLGGDLAKGTIIEVANGRRDLAGYIKYDYHPRLAKLIAEYRTLRDKHPLHALVIDVRVADALWSVAKIVDAYVTQEVLRSEAGKQSFDDVNKSAYAFVFGLQRSPAQAHLDFVTLKHLVSTGRCDGIESLGRPYLKASLRRLLKERRGLVFGEVAAVLRKLVEDNFSSRLGGFLLNECAAGVRSLSQRHSKLGSAAASELARVVGSLSQKFEELVIKANSDSRLASTAARYFANLMLALPDDERREVRTTLLSKGADYVIAECLLTAPWLLESSALVNKIQVVAEALSGLVVNNWSDWESFQTPIVLSRQTDIVPASGPLKTLVVTLNPTIIDKIWPSVVYAVRRNKGAPALSRLLAMRLQRERAASIGVEEGQLFVTSLTTALGLFGPGSSARHQKDLELLGKIVECGAVQEVAEIFHNLTACLGSAACRDIAKVYVDDSHAIVRDLRTILNICLSFDGPVTVKLGNATCISDVLDIFSRLKA